MREAADRFRAAISLDPRQADFHAGLADALFKRGALAESEAAWRAAVARAPQRADLLYGLAEVLRHRGEHAQAGALYRDILSRDAAHQGAGYHLAALGDRPPPPAMPAALVRSFFDGYAPAYDRILCERLAYRAPELLRELLDSVCQPAPRSWSVLDLGCGTGLGGLVFRDLARRLVGVDLSGEMVERARARRLYDRLVVGDMIETLRDEGPELDLIIAVFVSDYLGDLGALFEAAAACLRPGGRFGLTVEEGKDAADYALRPNGRYVHSAGYLERLSADTGLRVEQRGVGATREQDGLALDSLFFLFRRDG